MNHYNSNCFNQNPEPGSPADILKKLHPIVIDMSLAEPLPVYYAYCRRKNTLDVEKMANHIDDSFPCLLLGEAGTSRSSVAYSLYQLLVPKHPVPAYRIDCSLLDSSISNFLFKHEDSPLYGGTVYLFLYELFQAQYELQKDILDFLIANKCWVAASLKDTCEHYIQKKMLMPELAVYLSKNQYQMEPLRENPSEINFLSNLLLNHYNMEYGRHVLGFGAKAMEALEQYEWPGNISQLAQLMSVLVRQSKDPYISDSLVRFYLSKDEKELYSDTFWLKINFSMTLKEIDRYIAECVLQQESWNQTKTAKRLGISRSTLWRMLQED